MDWISVVSLLVATILIGVGGTVLILDCLDDILEEIARYKRNTVA